MAAPYRTSKQPITMLEVTEQVKTYQEALTEAEYDLKVAEDSLRTLRDKWPRLRSRVTAWTEFAKTLKNLP